MTPKTRAAGLGSGRRRNGDPAQSSGLQAARCDELWRRVANPTEPKRYYWTELFKAVVLQEASNWPSRLNELVPVCPSVEELYILVSLVRFKGSLVIFRQPEFVRRVLHRAEILDGLAAKEALRFSLYQSAGPQGRSFTNGKLDEDYVEAAAAKAAEAHAEDSVLGPFYRWIVEAEQRDRFAHQARFEAETAELE